MSNSKTYVARDYQLEAFKKANERNTIIFLETGGGKTFISVLLIKERSSALDLNSKNRKWTIFLAPVVPLVKQQAEYIELHTGLKIGVYCGEMGVDYWDMKKWKQVHFDSIES